MCPAIVEKKKKKEKTYHKRVSEVRGHEPQNMLWKEWPSQSRPRYRGEKEKRGGAEGGVEGVKMPTVRFDAC